MAQDGPDSQKAWFYEGPQGLDGPHTKEELQSLILEGVIALSHRVYHMENNEWHLAHELFPTLAEKAGAAKQFQLPTKPKEIKRQDTPAELVSGSEEFLGAIAGKNIKTITKARHTKPGFMEKTKTIVLNAVSDFGSQNKDRGFFNGRTATVLGATAVCTFGLWYATQDPARDPAEAKKEKRKTERTVSVPAQPMPSAMSGRIGSGQNPVARHLGAQASEEEDKARQLLNQESDRPQNPTPNPQTLATSQNPPSDPPAQPTETERHFDPSAFEQTNAVVNPPDVQGSSEDTAVTNDPMHVIPVDRQAASVPNGNESPGVDVPNTDGQNLQPTPEPYPAEQQQ